MSRTLPALAVAALIVLSGCATFGGVSTTREAFDVTDTSTDEPTTPDGPVDGPPVIAFDPLQDTAPEPFALAEAHEDSLLGRSYTVQYAHRETYVNGSRRLVQNWTTTFGRNRSTFVQDRYSALQNDSVRQQVYANGTHAWDREFENDRRAEEPRVLRSPTGDRLPPSQVVMRVAPFALRSGLLAMNVTDVTKLDTTPSGVDAPVFEVVGNETRMPNPYGNETTNASFTLFVTESGRVIEFAYEYTYEQDGNRIHASTRIEYRDVGTATVIRPEWVPGNATPANDAHVDEDTDPVASTTGPVDGAAFHATDASALAAPFTTPAGLSTRRARCIEAPPGLRSARV
ncbi:hypothetical protein G9C85_01670 [Halorubellus sp. JP-L1]|nr:hypothetical protein [Halorubellus sp. JP-L1]